VIISNNIFEVENFLEPDEQQKLVTYFCSPGFPWALTVDAVSGVYHDIRIEDDSVVGLFHTFLYDGKICSSKFDDISWILEKFKTVNLNPENLFRIRAGMFLKHPDAEPHPAHVDAKFKHITAVYYVNDCDGDFYLWNETNIQYPFKKPDAYTLKYRARPRQGKLIVLNGEHYHSSSYPNQKALRVAITFNFAVPSNI
jgi:hypothetical protein